jgi:uncharacterized protein (TIGR03435 family)
MRHTLLLLLAVGMPAQTPKPAFEVVSIKTTLEDPMDLVHAGIHGMQVDDAQAVYRATPLWTLLQAAFRLPDDQIVMPSWTMDVRLNIEAKLPAGSSKAQVPEMLQTLLADRMKMTFHHEERIRPIYFLVRGKGALALTPSAGGNTIGCNGGAGGHHKCQNITMDQFAAFLGRGRSMPPLAGGVSVWLDRPVLNHTGIEGAFDFPLDFGCVGSQGGGCPAEQIVPLGDAVKTLGLSLESSKAPYDMVIIDHIERAPVEN